MIMKSCMGKMPLGIAAGFLLVFCLGMATIASAEDNGFAGQSGEFLRYATNIRVLGMGGAGVGMAGDVTGLFYNPVGLTRLPRQYQAYAMSSTLYGESRYNVIACNFATGNPIATKYPLIWGIGLINHADDDFERRSETDVWLGSFGVKEQAAMIGAASEMVGSFGVFSYGITGKFIRQEIADESANGVGLDVGFQLQIINPTKHTFPAIQAIAPLRFGVSWQNVIQPSLKLARTSETYPLRFRFGVSGDYKVADSMRIVVANDIERLSHANDCRTWRWYSGAELRYAFSSVATAGRIGYNNLDKRISLGAGIAMPIFGVDARFDFAVTGNEYLSDDYRFAVTLDFGALLGKEEYHRRAKTYHNAHDSVMARINYLQVISRFDGIIDDLTDSAAVKLADVYDTVNADRYYALIGGLGLANRIFEDVKVMWQKDDEINDAAMKVLGEGKATAEKDSTDFQQKVNSLDNKAAAKITGALEEYRKVGNDDTAKFDDSDWMNYAESYMMKQMWDSALQVLIHVKKTDDLRFNYLQGVCNQKLGNHDVAADFYRKNIQSSDSNGLISLSILNYGKAMVKKLEKQRPDSAIVTSVIRTLQSQIADLRESLDVDYPRYFRSYDRDIADDMQYVIGQCYELLGETEKARDAYAKTSLFYKDSDLYLKSRERVNTLLKK